jgi:ketosteroid isomerase-like protein
MHRALLLTPLLLFEMGCSRAVVDVEHCTEKVGTLVAEERGQMLVADEPETYVLVGQGEQLRLAAAYLRQHQMQIVEARSSPTEIYAQADGLIDPVATACRASKVSGASFQAVRAFRGNKILFEVRPD